MAIRLQHNVPLELVGGLAQQVGQGQADQRQRELDDSRTRFLLGLREQQRQFDVRTGIGLQEQALQRQQYGQQLAQRDALQRQQLFNQEQEREAALAKEAMRQQFAQDQQQQEQLYNQSRWGIKTLDDQINDRMKEFRQLELNPEGKRIFGEMSGRLREIQSQRGGIRPDAYNQLLAQWFDDFEGMGLDSYEVKQPTADEQFFQSLVSANGQPVAPGEPLAPGKYLYVNGERNGRPTFAELDIGEKFAPQTVAERWEQNSVELPWGGRAIYDPETKKWQEFTPPTQGSSQQKPVDASKYVRDAISNLRAKHQLDNTGVDKPPAFNPSKEKIKEEAQKLLKIQKELEASLGGGEESPKQAAPSSIFPPSQGGFSDQSTRPVPVNSYEEASVLSPGMTFTYNGRMFRVTGIGEVEPVE